jgi:hypothetical protein
MTTRSRILPFVPFLAGFFVAAALAAGADSPPPTTRTDPNGLLLNRWFSEGTAAGHAGDYYDNRDGGHSRLDPAKYPQLRPLPYLDSQRAEKKDYGPPREIRPETVLGNASLAGSALGGASIPRMMASTREGLGFLAGQFLANQLYVFPEHQDHDPSGEGLSGYGDLYAVNSPYLVVSQGSSGSDQPFLDAIAMTMASFTPEVKELLRKEKLLMPVVQQILRSSLKPFNQREDYLTALAHPSAFPAEWLDEETMMRSARALTPLTLPPLLQLEVVREPAPPRPGIDFFEGPGKESESLSDQGMVIARIFRGMARDRELTVRVTRTREWAGRPLQIHWRLLRGDPNLVTIERSPTAPEATIRVRWHPDPIAAPGGPPRLSGHRVEIGVFADNGTSFSPPCFVTFCFLPNERRHYDETGRILETDYAFPGSFTDVTLTSEKPWRDQYRYDKDSGTLLGWTRSEQGKDPVQFDADGREVTPGGPRKVTYGEDPVSKRLRFSAAD